jgi:hypothetical protein
MTDPDLSLRLQQLLDEHDIAKLIASYGPAVDAGNADDAADLWAPEGSYDVEGWRMEGRRGVHDMVASSAHQDLVSHGCCHFLGPAVVTVDGDRAVAVCESLVLLRDDDRELVGGDYRVWRATANHFTLQRFGGHWQITRRSSRILNGDPHARELLTTGLRGVPAPDEQGE